jgi:hypothetical protein
MSKPQTIPALPADAVGFIGRRKDRPERLAMFAANGALMATFSPDDTTDTIAALIAPQGLRVVEGGIVVR